MTEILSPKIVRQVEFIAHSIAKRTGRYADLEDFIQEGYVGFLQARARHDAGRGIQLNSFAQRRIYGQIVDSMRRTDFFSRSRPGRNPLRLIGIDSADIPKSLLASRDNSERDLLDEETRKRVDATLCTLPKRQRLVLWLYYFDDLSMEQIGKVLGITQGRVSQIFQEARRSFEARYMMAGFPQGFRNNRLLTESHKSKY